MSTTTIGERLPGVIDLNPEESKAFFDDAARQLLGISGDEFAARWAAGEYDDIADDPEHREVLYLAMLGPMYTSGDR